MAAEIVSLAERRHPAIAEGAPVLDGLLRLVAESSDPTVALLFLTSIFCRSLRGFGVQGAELAALAAGEVELEVLAARYAGQMWGE